MKLQRKSMFELPAPAPCKSVRSQQGIIRLYTSTGSISKTGHELTWQCSRPGLGAGEEMPEGPSVGSIRLYEWINVIHMDTRGHSPPTSSASSELEPPVPEERLTTATNTKLFFLTTDSFVCEESHTISYASNWAQLADCKQTHTYHSVIDLYNIVICDWG